MSTEAMDQIHSRVNAIAAEAGYVEDVDYEDSCELAELVLQDHVIEGFSGDEVMHAMTCYTDECNCED